MARRGQRLTPSYSQFSVSFWVAFTSTKEKIRTSCQSLERWCQGSITLLLPTQVACCDGHVAAELHRSRVYGTGKQPQRAIRWFPPASCDVLFVQMGLPNRPQPPTFPTEEPLEFARIDIPAAKLTLTRKGKEHFGN